MDDMTWTKEHTISAEPSGVWRFTCPDCSGRVVGRKEQASFMSFVHRCAVGDVRVEVTDAASGGLWAPWIDATA